MAGIGRIVVALAGVGLLAVPWQPPAVRTAEGGGQKGADKAAKKDDRKQEKDEVGKGPAGLPMVGKANRLLDPLDEGIEKIMLRHGVPGASVAITRKGKLIYARGYGWSFHEKETLTTPQTLFGL